MHQAQPVTCISETPVQHCSTTCLPAITTASSSSAPEDTDQKRNLEHGEESQLQNLAWLGMDWDEGPDKPGKYGPYRQSERQHIYDPLVDQLLLSNRAYKCYCNEEELETEREQQRARGEMPHYGGKCANLTPSQQAEKEAQGITPVIRFRVPIENTYTFDDIVKGPITFEASSVGGDYIIRKRDGFPTYNFAVAVDDHMMAITHVLRGDDHIANTPKQMMIYEAFDWKIPTFGHMTLIINSETGKKLSKRDETILQFIEQYKDLGYLPEAMFNFITLLGWSPVGEDEIFSKEDLIKMFDSERLSKSPAAFDQKKLEWINNQYMKSADLDAIVTLAAPHLVAAGKLPENPSEADSEYAKKLIGLYHEQMSYAAEIVDLSEMFFADEINLDAEAQEINGCRNSADRACRIQGTIGCHRAVRRSRNSGSHQGSPKRNQDQRQEPLYGYPCRRQRPNARA